MLLYQNEEVRERWQQKIRYLLVDEYQDTNTANISWLNCLWGSEQGLRLW